jgi:hypothetical protein
VGLTKLYDALENQEHCVSKEIALLIKKNLQCAAGNVYEMSFDADYCSEFKSLVRKIALRKDIRSNISAFQFIGNSINNDSGNNFLVDDEFVPILKKMWLDPLLENFCKSDKYRRQFFEKNINR